MNKGKFLVISSFTLERFPVHGTNVGKSREGGEQLVMRNHREAAAWTKQSPGQNSPFRVAHGRGLTSSVSGMQLRESTNLAHQPLSQPGAKSSKWNDLGVVIL